MADNMTYQQLADEVQADLDSAPIGSHHMVRVARDAVREVCKRTQLLKQTQEFEWSNDREYRLDHAGYTLCSIRNIWLYHKADTTRLDSSFEQDLEMGNDTSILRLPAHYDIPGKPKLFVEYAIMPKTTSEGFPRMLYEHHDQLLRYGVLKNAGNYARQAGGKQVINPWHALFEQELRKERTRVAGAAGAPYMQPYYGGYDEYIEPGTY